MKLKIKVFLVLSIPIALMLLLQFFSGVYIYFTTQKLIKEYVDNLFIDQQQQTILIMSAYSYEFNKIFQQLSINLQAFVNFESKILADQVKFNTNYKQTAVFIESLYANDQSQQEYIDLYKQSDLLMSIWYHPNISDFQLLDSVAKTQIQRAGKLDFLWRVFVEASRKDQSSRSVPYKDIYQGFLKEGILYSTSTNTTFSKYVPPASCTHTGKYKFDSRCRQWFTESVKRVGVTPIEPILFFSQVGGPFLATNICQSQNVQQVNKKGEVIWIPYSVDCLNFKLSTLYQFFNDNTFDSSTTVMIDPRSQIAVYNQLEDFNNQIVYLNSTIKDLFPNDTSKQSSFYNSLLANLNQSYNLNYQTIDSTNSQHYGTGSTAYRRPQGQESTSFDYYIQRLSQIDTVDADFDRVHSFVFDYGDDDVKFITITPIVLIEKLGPFQRLLPNQQNRIGYDIQDLFVVIDILPKSYLTEFTDQLLKEMSIYFIGFGIGSSVLSILLLVVSGIISYKVALMIETPLSHMINLLQKLEKEGSQVTLDLIDNTSHIPEEQIFLSLDSFILFESFKRMFKMLHLATQDIFHVEESQSLLCLNYQVSFFKQFNNYRVLGVLYNNMGNIHFQNERYTEALENYSHSIVYGYYELGLYREKTYNSSKDNSSDPERYLSNPIRVSSLKNKRTSSNNNNNNTISENKTLKFQIDGISAIPVCSPSTTKIRNTNSSGRNQMSRVDSNQQDQNQCFQPSMNQPNEFEVEDSIDIKNMDSINSILFDRKFNFTKAFFMKNLEINKQDEGRTTLWEEYEVMLLDLIVFNEKLKSISYGRTVILTTMLSNCYLKMNDHKRSIQQQKQAIRSYNDALQIESLMKRHSLKKQPIDVQGGILRGLESSNDDQSHEVKSSQPQYNNNNNLSIQNQEFIDEHLNDSFKKKRTNRNEEVKSLQSPAVSEYYRHTLDMHYILQMAQKNQEEEISIDNLFRKRYSNVHSIGDSEQPNNMHFNQNNNILASTNSYSNQNSRFDTLKNGIGIKKTDDEIKQAISAGVTQNIKNAMQNIALNTEKNEYVTNDSLLNKFQNEFDKSLSPRSPTHQYNQEKDRIESEHCMFNRKPRQSKYLQQNLPDALKTTRDRRSSKEKYMNNYSQTIQNNNKSFSLSRPKQNNNFSSRNSLRAQRQAHNSSQSPPQNFLQPLHHNSLNSTSPKANLLLSSNNVVCSKNQTITQAKQATQNNNQGQFSYLLEHQPHKSNTLPIRQHANSTNQSSNTRMLSSAHSYGRDSYRPRSSAYNIRPRNSLLSNKLSVIPSIQAPQNGMNIDYSNNRLTSHGSYNGNSQQNGRNKTHSIRCKDCSVYDDIASVCSQQQLQQQTQQQSSTYPQQMLKKQKIKKKNLQLISKINKNLEENEGKKISKYQLPCNILLCYVGLQEAKILIYEKQYQSAAIMLTELLENVKYYLPYYRKQCLLLLNDIFTKNEIPPIKQLESMLERFNDSISFKVVSIIAVNTAYSDAAKSCQHLIKEVLIRDDDLFSMIIYNSHILKQVMPLTLMKQIKSAQDYFDTLLSYISGDADSVDISSYSSYLDDEFNAHSNVSLPVNSNHNNIINSNNNNNTSFLHTNTIHTYNDHIENNDCILTTQNDNKPLFFDAQGREIQQLMSSPNQGLLTDNYFLKGSQRTILGLLDENQLDSNKFFLTNPMMAIIKESSKEINLVESNLMDTNKVISPSDNKKTLSDSQNNGKNSVTLRSKYNGESFKLLKNSIIFEKSENNDNADNTSILQSGYIPQLSHKNSQVVDTFTRQKSKSLMKSSQLNQSSNAHSDYSSRKRKRTNTLPHSQKTQRQIMPVILINHKTLSQHQLESQNQILQSLVEKTNSSKKIILSNSEIKNIIHHSKENIQQGKPETQSSDILLPLKITQQQSELNFVSQKQQQQQEEQKQPQSIVNQNDEMLIRNKIESEVTEEDEQKYIHTTSSAKLFLPLIKSTFGKQEDLKRCKSHTSQPLDTSQVNQSVYLPGSLYDKKLASLGEQDEEQLETPLSQNQIVERNQAEDIQSLRRITMQASTKDEEALQMNALDQENAENITEDNLSNVFHMAVRKALLSFFQDDIVRYQLQRKISELNQFNTCLKIIVFISDISGFKENKLYDLLAEELYKTSTQLLVLQLDFEESIQENTLNQDVLYNGKSVIKYFYTQEKLLQYIRNKREPMKNFGIPVMMEHFQ